MSTSQFISVRETAQILGISEKRLMDFIGSEKLQSYRIADKFLRLKKDEVLELRNTGNIVRENNPYTYTTAERFQDFFYFNDFYVIVFVILLALLYVIFYT